MGIIGGIIGVAILLFIIYSAGTAKQATSFNKLQKLCQNNAKRFEYIARDMRCWNIVVGSFPPSPLDGWYEFIPAPGRSNIRYWLKFNGALFQNEQDAFSSLTEKMEMCERADAALLKAKSAVSSIDFNKSQNNPGGFPPVGSIISYHWFSYKDGVHMDGRASFTVKYIYDEDKMLIKEGNGKMRTMSYSEYRDIFTNPISDCKIESPS